MRLHARIFRPPSSSTGPAAPAPAAPRTNPALRDQFERATAPLVAVHEFLRLLCDCGGANTARQSTMRMDSLAVVLRDLAEQLAEVELLINDMAMTGATAFPDTGLCGTIERQGYIVVAVHHGLRVLYDAIGANCRDQHEINADAFVGTLHLMANRLQAVEVALGAIAFPREAVSVALPAHADTPAPAPAPAPISVIVTKSSTRRAHEPTAGKRHSVRTAMEASA